VLERVTKFHGVSMTKIDNRA